MRYFDQFDKILKCIQNRNGRSQVFDGLIKIMFNRMESSRINNIVTFLTLNHKLKYKLDKVKYKKKNFFFTLLPNQCCRPTMYLVHCTRDVYKMHSPTLNFGTKRL